MAGGYADGSWGRTTEVHEGDRDGWRRQASALYGEMVPVEVDLLAVPKVAHDRQELPRAGITVVFFQEVPIRALLLPFAPRDHVDEQPSP